MHHQHHLYRGHRASSFSAIDLIELNELRARQRTFDGAYRRTALACLGYALTVLRLFDVRFYKIGILYSHDFADRSSEKLSTLYKQAIATVGQEDAREFGRPFVTAGFDVALITVVVFAVEIAILALIIEL
ncbi:hypothetical protein BKA82DRAFT_4186487 [Pisolithus tinctorius]|nr:hypothetical protein BKA82DRAFT_4186487 [Pisolithus tinctorius]